MGDINLLYPAIIALVITLLLFKKSKEHDRYLLFIMIIGQLILISGESDKNRDKIQISHIFFTLSIVIGSFYFKEPNNLYFIGTLILLRIITRFIYKDCLFLMSSSHHKLEIESYFESYFGFINWNLVFFVSLMIIIYRLLNN